MIQSSKFDEQESILLNARKKCSWLLFTVGNDWGKYNIQRNESIKYVLFSTHVFVYVLQFLSRLFSWLCSFVGSTFRVETPTFLR